MKHLKLFQTQAEFDASTLELPNVSFIEETKHLNYQPKPIPPVGACIYGVDKKFYSCDEWYAGNKSNDEAIGVVFYDGEHDPFVIYPANIVVNRWGAVGTTELPKQYDISNARNDFDGKSNTEIILKAASNYSKVAAKACYDVVFKHGKRGYLASAGQFYSMCALDVTIPNVINECLEAIGGYVFAASRQVTHWTSSIYGRKTNSSEDHAWAFNMNSNDLKTYADTTSDFCVRPIAEL